MLVKIERICVIFWLIYYVNCEVFTSVGHLTTLVESIAGVTKNLEDFLNDEYARLEKAKEMIHEFRNLSDFATKDPEKFVGNPVNSFLLIKKLSNDLQKVIDLLGNYPQAKELVDKINDDYMLPSDEDYKGAAIALHRLEDTYKLKPADIRLGKLSSNYPSRELTAFECFELGRVAYEQKDFYHTIHWMNEALYLLETEYKNSTIDKVTVLDYLAYANAQQGNIKHALDLTIEMIKIDPTHSRAQDNVEFYRNKLRNEINRRKGDQGDNSYVSDNPYEYKNERPPSPYPEREQYEALCRGETPEISPKRLSKLKCRYLNHNPLLLIAPVKEEQVFDRPAIWVYHDVITDEQIRVMKSLGSPKLKRAIVRSPVTGEYVTADYRISKSGWLKDEEHSQLRYLTKLVNAITNLSLETAEEWQIANYGIGGQYEPHFDFARANEPGRAFAEGDNRIATWLSYKTDPENAFHVSVGNRIATWLFYLEVPERGGATVFPPIGISIQPKRRSAAFWYNLHRSGDGDYDTRHAACPVLIGTKWVSNKWIHFVGQEFNRPCSLVREFSPEMQY